MKSIMKKGLYVLLSLVMILTNIMPFTNPKTQAATYLNIGNTRTLSAGYVSPSYPASTTVSRTYMWSVSNSNVLSLERYGSSCYVTAIGSGTATVTCKVSMSYQSYDSRLGTYLPRYEQAFAGSWSFEVARPSPTGISINSSVISFNGNFSSRSIGYTLYPSNAETTISGFSSNTSVATVSGTTIYPRGIGSATITLRTANGYSDSVLVYVSRGMDLDETTEIIQKGKTKTLHADVLTIGESDPKITWKSSNTKVAKVNSKGKVTAVGAGQATISASTKDGASDTCLIKVPKAVPTKITLSPSSRKIEKDSSYKLKVKRTPSNASLYLSWKSSDSSIASVDQEGNVTAHKAGTVTITATAFNGKKDTSKITVTVPAKTIDLSLENANHFAADYLYIGAKGYLISQCSPSNHTSKITYKSDNTKVATVNSKGEVTAKTVGYANISVYADGKKKDTYKIKVYREPTKLVLSENKMVFEHEDTFVSETAKLTYKLYPSSSKAKVYFSSNNNSVVSVDDNGNLVTKGIGKAKITVRASVSKGLQETCEIEVTRQAKDLNLKRYNLPDYIYKDETLQLKYAFTPSDATGVVTFTSSDSKVAKVSKAGLVTPKKTGTIRINAYLDGRVKDFKDLTVYNRPTKLTLDQEEIHLGTGASAQLKSKLSPSPTYAEVTYTSSDKGVATVDENGLIIAQNKSGTAVISASVLGNVVDSCKVIVHELRLESEKDIYAVGDTETLNFGVSEDVDFQPILTSNNPDVVSVDNNGLLMALSPGIATITLSYDEIKTAEEPAITLVVKGAQIFDISEGLVSVDVDTGTITQGSQSTAYDHTKEIILSGNAFGAKRDTSDIITIDNDNVEDADIKIRLYDIYVLGDETAIDLKNISCGSVELISDGSKTKYNQIYSYAIGILAPEYGRAPLTISGSHPLRLDCNGDPVLGGDYYVSNIDITCDELILNDHAGKIGRFVRTPGQSLGLHSSDIPFIGGDTSISGGGYYHNKVNACDHAIIHKNVKLSYHAYLENKMIIGSVEYLYRQNSYYILELYYKSAGCVGNQVLADKVYSANLIE